MATSHAENGVYPSSPPYAPTSWQFGGQPEMLPDVPICSVYIVCYLVAAITHQTVFVKNMKRGQKFVMSAMTFGFCTLRIITFSTRLAWSIHPRNAKLALVSNVLLNAGIPILYIINLVFAQRLTRAQHPRLGWHRSLSIAGRVIIAMMLLTLVILIYSGVQSAYTTSTELHRMTRIMQKYGTTFNCVIAILPLVLLLVGLLIPQRVQIENFGAGRHHVKVLVLMTSSLLLTIRALWSTTTLWLDPVPLSQPMPWYFSKPAFYTVLTLSELLVVYMFILVRINRIFYTPDGLPRGSYIDLNATKSWSRPTSSEHQGVPVVATLGFYSEDELFGKSHALADTLRFSSTSLLLDSASGKWQLQRHSLSDIYSPSFDRGSFQGRQSHDIDSLQSWAPSSHYSIDKSSSSRTPSTWNRERYERQKGNDSRARGAGSVKSLRWSAPAKEKDIMTGSSRAPSERSTSRWSTPLSSNPPSRRRSETSVPSAEQREPQRMSSQSLTANVSSSPQDPPPVPPLPGSAIYFAPIPTSTEVEPSPQTETIAQPVRAQQGGRSPLVTETFETNFLLPH